MFWMGGSITTDDGCFVEGVDCPFFSCGVLSIGLLTTANDGSSSWSALIVVEGPRSTGQLEGEDSAFRPVSVKGAVGCCSGPGAVENI